VQGFTRGRPVNLCEEDFGEINRRGKGERGVKRGLMIRRKFSGDQSEGFCTIGIRNISIDICEESACA
jgi:hypothetical protein